MSKGYILSVHRSEANPVIKQLIIYWLKMLLKKAGGRIIAMAKIDGSLTVSENDIKQSTVFIEFNSFYEAIDAYHSSDCQKHYLPWIMVLIGISEYLKVFA